MFLLMSSEISHPPRRFLPETLRAMVGNGSIRPPKIYRPLVPIFAAQRSGQPTSDEDPKIIFKFKNPLRILTYPDVLVRPRFW